MYDDPHHIRDHVVKVSLNEGEMDLLGALAKFNGHQKPPLARKILLDGLRRMMADDSQHQLLAS